MVGSVGQSVDGWVGQSVGWWVGRSVSQSACLSVYRSVCLCLSAIQPITLSVSIIVQLPVFSQSINHSFTLRAIYTCLTKLQREALIAIYFIATEVHLNGLKPSF